MDLEVPLHVACSLVVVVVVVMVMVLVVEGFAKHLQNPKSWRLFRSGPLRGFSYLGIAPPL